MKSRLEMQDWVIVAMITIVVLATLASLKENLEWNKFAAKHNCVVVEKERATTLVTTDGKAVVQPAKTAYKCDDGVTYWR